MFKYNDSVKFSETNTRGELSVPALFNYFQDVSELHAEALNDAAEESRKYAWILNSWQIQIRKMPSLSEKIVIGTVPHLVKNFEAQRNFILWDEKQTILANANTYWTFINKETLRPEKITEEQIKIYAPEEPFPMNYEPRKISIREIPEEAFKETGKVKVLYSMLDQNHHMNNARYAEVACNFLPEAFEWNQIRIEYKKSAVLNDEITVFSTINDGALYMLLKNAQGEALTVTEFKKVNL